jgi:hypothetical protein
MYYNSFSEAKQYLTNNGFEISENKNGSLFYINKHTEQLLEVWRLENGRTRIIFN